MSESDAHHEGGWRRSRKAIGFIALSLVIVAVAERDIHRSANAEIRGNKSLWRLLSTNALGALAYFKWGRLPRGSNAR
jgi:hypothetical protein